MKNSFFTNLLRILAVVTILGGLGVATVSTTYAQNIKESIVFKEDAPTGAETSLGKGLGTLTQWIFYVFYLVGGVFMGIGAFKLKQGDMGGFGKNMAGGATLFFVPAAIRLFKGIGEVASG